MATAPWRRASAATARSDDTTTTGLVGRRGGEQVGDGVVGGLAGGREPHPHVLARLGRGHRVVAVEHHDDLAARPGLQVVEQRHGAPPLLLGCQPRPGGARHVVAVDHAAGWPGRRPGGGAPPACRRTRPAAAPGGAGGRALALAPLPLPFARLSPAGSAHAAPAASLGAGSAPAPRRRRPAPRPRRRGPRPGRRRPRGRCDRRADGGPVERVAGPAPAARAARSGRVEAGLAGARRRARLGAPRPRWRSRSSASACAGGLAGHLAGRGGPRPAGPRPPWRAHRGVALVLEARPPRRRAGRARPRPRPRSRRTSASCSAARRRAASASAAALRRRATAGLVVALGVAGSAGAGRRTGGRRRRRVVEPADRPVQPQPAGPADGVLVGLLGHAGPEDAVVVDDPLDDAVGRRDRRENPSTGPQPAGAGTRGSAASPSMATATARRHAARQGLRRPGRAPGSRGSALGDGARRTSSIASTLPAAPHQRHSTDSIGSSSTCSSSTESSPPTV